jgi:hypothetical protein
MVGKGWISSLKLRAGGRLGGVLGVQRWGGWLLFPVGPLLFLLLLLDLSAISPSLSVPGV